MLVLLSFSRVIQYSAKCCNTFSSESGWRIVYGIVRVTIWLTICSVSVGLFPRGAAPAGTPPERLHVVDLLRQRRLGDVRIVRSVRHLVAQPYSSSSISSSNSPPVAPAANAPGSVAAAATATVPEWPIVPAAAVPTPPIPLLLLLLSNP